VPTVILRGTTDDTFAVPLAWTDRAEPSSCSGPEHIPLFFSASRLLSLVELIDSLRPREERKDLS
jgi:hypothetical protein